MRGRGDQGGINEVYSAVRREARDILGEDYAGDDPGHTFPPTLADIAELIQKGPTLARLVLQLDRKLRDGSPLPAAWGAAYESTSAAKRKRKE